MLNRYGGYPTTGLGIKGCRLTAAEEQPLAALIASPAASPLREEKSRRWRTLGLSKG